MKALSVFSGGLDSILAAEIVRAQGIQVQAVFFESPFFSSKNARKSAEHINLPLKVVDITERHLKIVKHPRHGYGEHMNPCIDCHTLMFRVAGEMLEDEGASFIITGEVLGQRPMSQNRNALTLIDSESGFKGLILRPLSAKHLQLTIPEEKGWIDRKALLNLSGRSRKPQMELAKKLDIKEYPSPAGGCLLTDKIFSQRLEDLLRSKTNPDIREIDLLRSGRHFRIGDETKVIVGRHKSENQVIKSLSDKDDLLMRTTSVPGPTTLVVGKILSDTAELAAIMTVSYSDAEEGVLTEVSVISNNKENTLRVTGRAKKEFQHYMVS